MIIKHIFDYLIMSYTFVICLSYLILGLVSATILINHNRKSQFADYHIIHSSPFAPTISIIAPAYNESKTIVDNIRALLALHYNIFEVIIVNDGSTDDSIDKVIKEYELEKVDYFVNPIIPTKEIKGVYRSQNKAFTNLTVIDKINGGKADALNAGLNVSKYDYFLAIDVDSVIDPIALLKLIKPIIEASDKKVIATGGAVRIVNSCNVNNGNIVNIEIPRNFWAKFQILEYTRAFLMGRIAWSKLNGLLLVSGALGLFDKKIAIECGGYSNETVGEDMELVVRMRRHMYERKIKHEVVYIPDPLCWTEVPETIKTLSRQRNRWTRGTMGTLFMHKKVFFNPKYGSMGMIGYPYWFFFEWLAPLIEFSGIVYFAIMAITGHVNWSYFILLLAFIYLFAVAFSFFSILYEELTFHKYYKRLQILKLFLTAIIEPFFYHQMTVFWAIKGNIAYWMGEKGWGVMERFEFKKR
ncbi:MAG: glycosyltransferase [Bacteroidota bacterium]|nr:glycosyltransferase [Bacteroidota bacterium]